MCPWCVIGYKQFEKALAALPGRFDVAVHWRPFELNPNMPPEGQDLREHITQKYGSTAEQSQQARSRLSSIGESLGFHFDYFDGMRVVNTFQAHQLLHWAESHDKQTELKMALFKAFFSERQDVSDADVLISAAVAVGLPETDARDVISSGRYADAVREDQRWWLDREIHAVPAFIFNDKYSVLGAQEAETFVRVLTKLEAKAAA
ncbi:putative dithiol-disulfide isomerase involved in polyketide biosynthesis [Congregibacter litoralis KT71]|uniref:Putative dithiol-disulfide isomerase involved in polyketide biosynthesis n=1 Tax=Congregibacter litoralis KT71 TaxID=314285 RepID=A4AB67_9GAMM|nr:putative dithiol-disulfide isomerase involved in polyketide biosynthesis [Congregibacter litoralis KT71]